MLLPPTIADLLARIPLSARTILDVGHGDGGLLGAYRRLNPNARLFGISHERQQDNAGNAASLEALAPDIEAEPLPPDLHQGVDCIIYNDVLQHLRDPWAMVQRHAEALSPDGVMLFVVPNAEYWRLTERRLRGVLDETASAWDSHPHGQWLTKAGLQAHLRRAGLVPFDMTYFDPDPVSAKWFCETLTPGLSALGIDPTDFTIRAGASYLICRARRTAPEPIILSGNMLPPIGGVSHVRVVHPLQANATEPGVTSILTDQVDLRPPTDATPRIFVLHRPAFSAQQGLETIQKLTQAGYLVVTEFDDHPDHFQMMQVGGEVSFLGAHALQTSTPVMAEVLQQYNPDVAMFPNAIVSLPDVKNFTDPQSMTLFFGALNREADWQPLMPIINSVAAAAGSRLAFQVVHDQGFFDALDTPHKTFTPTCDYETYLRILGDCEISFMPLGDTTFNRAKSDLKFIEAGACRVASLSSTIVYADTIQDGRNGMLFSNPTEFHSRLLRLIAMPNLARDLGEAARRYVATERMLAYQVGPRVAWYRSLWERREELEAARLARIQQRLAA